MFATIALLALLALAVLVLAVLQPSPAVFALTVTVPASSPPRLSFPASPPPASRPLRLSLTTRRRSSTIVRLDALDPSPPSSTKSAPHRARFVNPFGKHSRSRTLSPHGTTFKSSDSSPSILSPPSPPTRRRTFINKFKSIFKSVPPEPSPIVHSKPILATISARFRRKPVARMQPYGPPWNAPMPIPDLTLSQCSPQKFARTLSPSPQSSRARHCSPPETAPVSPAQLSPRTFINELDEKLALFQQQRIDHSIPSSWR